MYRRYQHGIEGINIAYQWRRRGNNQLRGERRRKLLACVATSENQRMA